eukprot:m.790656 g.790656  ORF g.790656 m.790656 type:complete len:219 (+) comp59203_c1_seq5:2472-3128(+)
MSSKFLKIEGMPDDGPQPPLSDTEQSVLFSEDLVDEDGDRYELYQSIYAYSSQDKDDLNFAAGEIIRVTDAGDGPQSWFYGKTQDGRDGNFPGTYVRKIAYVGKARSTLGATAPATAAPAAKPQVTAAVSAPKAAPAAQPQERPYVLYKALYSYNSKEDGDLTFEAGDILRVFEDDGAWFFGETQDCVQGSFPSNYVRKVVLPPGAFGSKAIAGLEHL